MNKKNNSGMSMLLVIAALLATGFIGVSLLKLGTSDQLSGVYFSSSESARNAAKAGITKALAELGTTDATKRTAMLAKLNAFISEPNPSGKNLDWDVQWLCGDHDTYDELSSGSDEQFKTRIIAFTEYKTDSFAITLESTGLGKGNSKSMSVGVYKLLNLGRTTTTSSTPQNALQMDNGNNEFNCELFVDGNTSFSDSLKFNNGPFYFKGKLRIDPHPTTGAVKTPYVDGDFTVDSNAYFNEPIVSNKLLTFKKSVGFDTLLGFSPGKLVVTDSLFTNSNLTLNGWNTQAITGTSLHMYKNANFLWGSSVRTYNEMFSGYNTTTKPSQFYDTKVANLPAKLGFGARPPVVPFNKDDVLAFSGKYTVTSGEAIGADELNSLFTTKPLYKGKFLIVHFPSSYGTPGGNGDLFKSTATKFNGKAIIVVDTDNWQTMKLSTETTANVGLGVFKQSKFVDTPHMKSSYFRGFIYVNDPNGARDFVFNNGGASTYKGAIYGSPTCKLRFLGGVKHSIIWDGDAINELASVGLFGSTSTSNLQLTGARIQSELLGQAM